MTYRAQQQLSSLVIAAVGGVVAAHDRASGTRRWSFAEADGMQVTRCAIAGDRVLVALQRPSQDNSFWSMRGVCDVVCLEYETGAVSWRTTVDPGDVNVAHVVTTLLVDGEDVLVACSPVLACLGVRDGRVRWSASIEGTEVRGGGHIARLPISLAVPGALASADRF